MLGISHFVNKLFGPIFGLVDPLYVLFLTSSLPSSPSSSGCEKWTSMSVCPRLFRSLGHLPGGLTLFPSCQPRLLSERETARKNKNNLRSAQDYEWNLVSGELDNNWDPFPISIAYKSPCTCLCVTLALSGLSLIPPFFVLHSCHWWSQDEELHHVGISVHVEDEDDEKYVQQLELNHSECCWTAGSNVSLCLVRKFFGTWGTTFSRNCVIITGFFFTGVSTRRIKWWEEDCLPSFVAFFSTRNQSVLKDRLDAERTTPVKEKLCPIVRNSYVPHQFRVNWYSTRVCLNCSKVSQGIILESGLAASFMNKSKPLFIWAISCSIFCERFQQHRPCGVPKKWCVRLSFILIVMTYHSCNHFGDHYWQSSSIRRIGRNNCPLPLGCKNGSLCVKDAWLGEMLKVSAQISLMPVGLVTWTGPVSWFLDFDFVKQGFPSSAFSSSESNSALDLSSALGIWISSTNQLFPLEIIT